MNLIYRVKMVVQFSVVTVSVNQGFSSRAAGPFDAREHIWSSSSIAKSSKFRNVAKQAYGSIDRNGIGVPENEENNTAPIPVRHTRIAAPEKDGRNVPSVRPNQENENNPLTIPISGRRRAAAGRVAAVHVEIIAPAPANRGYKAAIRGLVVYEHSKNLCNRRSEPSGRSHGSLQSRVCYLS